MYFNNGNSRVVCGHCVKLFKPGGEHADKVRQIENLTTYSMDDKKKICGNCALCVHFSSGCECALTDNSVEYNQDACIDYIDNED